MSTHRPSPRVCCKPSSHSSACCLRILSQRFCHNYFEDHNLIEGSVLGPHYFRTITSFKDLFSLLEPLLMIGSRLLPPDVECSFARCRHSSQVSTLSIDWSRPYLSTSLDLICRLVSTLFINKSRPYLSTSLDLIYEVPRFTDVDAPDDPDSHLHRRAHVQRMGIRRRVPPYRTLPNRGPNPMPTRTAIHMSMHMSTHTRTLRMPVGFFLDLGASRGGAWLELHDPSVAVVVGHKGINTPL